MTTKRIYKGKNVDMLTVCATIIENAIANQPFLITKRSKWTIEFFDPIKTRIDNAFRNCLGIDSALQMREATQLVVKIQTDALNDLAELKIQIEQDFKADKPRRDEILRQLGYAAYHRAAQARDQEALIQLLYQFKKVQTEALRNSITEKGIAPAIIDRINSYADQLSQLNITQETLKGTKKGIIEEANTELIEIYDQVISIAKIARIFYKGNPAKQDLFSYAKILKKLNAAAHTTEQQS